MVAQTRQKLIRLLEIDFVRFCIVGGTGFVINALLLSAFHTIFGFTIFVAQFFAAEIALFSNFMLHHHWTYKRKKVNKSLYILLVQFHVTSWPAIIGSALMVGAGVKVLHLPTIEALVLSSVIALGWNFGWSKYVLWRDVSGSEVEGLVK